MKALAILLIATGVAVCVAGATRPAMADAGSNDCADHICDTELLCGAVMHMQGLATSQALLAAVIPAIESPLAPAFAAAKITRAGIDVPSDRPLVLLHPRSPPVAFQSRRG